MATARPMTNEQSLEALKAGLNCIDQGLTLFDANLNLVYANKRVCDLLGLPEELARPGTPFETIIRWNVERGEYGVGDVEVMVKERVRAAWEFRPHTLERVRPNGVVVHVSGWPLPTGGFATVYSDITAQRRRELDLERRILMRTDELRQSEERLRLIANELPAGIAYVDISGQFQFVNGRFARAYNLKPEQIMGMRERDLLPKEVWDYVSPYFEKAVGGAPQTFDTPITFPDGRRLDIRTLLRPDRSTDQTINGFYVLSVNITREKQAVAALLQAQRIDALGQLSSGIAHDFNNLLTIILGNLKPLSDRIHDEYLRSEMLEPAIRATRRGADLMRRLLAVARRQPISPSRVDVGECVGEIVKLVRPSLGEDIKLTYECDENTPAAFADPALLETSLINLVINAADAMNCSGGSIKICTNANADGAVAIAVSDNGPGMDDTIRARIFEPFFSTKSDQSRNGLGLTMVQGFITDSGGSISVESELGHGTSFLLTLPAAADASKEIDRMTVTEGAGSYPIKDKLVLVIDDDQAVRRVLRRDLVAAGANVIEAENGAEGLEILRQVAAVSAIVSDVSMPVMDGITLANAARKFRRDLPIVLLSGYGADAVSKELPEGINILHKPCDVAAIAVALANSGRLRTREGMAAAGEVRTSSYEKGGINP
ncbi:hybrid sensor histidine kinase/response regulator [Neorhizobium sp. LjRoot104]|uniref:hybrid sensor histidine kinase/response regulator n=1 Tax=Neorhizobium sp. LjRoot104 TaxID=3342254 RepID=UPI003ECD2FA9